MNGTDGTPPKRRKVEDNVKISPKKVSSSKRLVHHYAVQVGDGTFMLDIPVVANRPPETEPYTLPVKKVIEDRTPCAVLLAGYVLVCSLVAQLVPNVLNNETLRNTRQYVMKCFAAQSDMPFTKEQIRQNLQVICDVSNNSLQLLNGNELPNDPYS